VSADGQDVRRPVREPHPGAGRGQLHDGLGVVGGRVLEALVRRRDAETGAVVERPVVQAGAPAARRRDHPGDGGGARGVEDRLRRLDLTSKPSRDGGRPYACSSASQTSAMASTWRTEVTLGSVSTKAARQVARLEHPGEHELQRPQPPPPGRGLEALEADAGPGRAVVRPRRGRDRRRGRSGGLVLLVARPDPVAVFEVDAQVLDRLARELVAHPGEHLLGADARSRRSGPRPTGRARRAGAAPRHPTPGASGRWRGSAGT
jgi:hypothetical protein